MSSRLYVIWDDVKRQLVQVTPTYPTTFGWSPTARDHSGKHLQPLDQPPLATCEVVGGGFFVGEFLYEKSTE